MHGQDFAIQAIIIYIYSVWIAEYKNNRTYISHPNSTSSAIYLSTHGQISRHLLLQVPVFLASWRILPKTTIHIFLKKTQTTTLFNLSHQNRMPRLPPHDSPPAWKIWLSFQQNGQSDASSLPTACVSEPDNGLIKWTLSEVGHGGCFWSPCRRTTFDRVGIRVGGKICETKRLAKRGLRFVGLFK